ncbi:sugar transferase [Georgenia sp.]
MSAAIDPAALVPLKVSRTSRTWRADARVRPALAPTTAPGWHRWAPAYRAFAITSDLVATFAIITVPLGLSLPRAEALTAGAVVAVGMVALIAMHHGYAKRSAATGAQEIAAIYRGGVFMVALMLAAMFLGDLDGPRIWFVGALVAAVATLALGRVVLRAVVRHLRSLGRFVRPTVVVGTRDHVESLISDLAESRALGLDPIGVCTVSSGDGSGGEQWPVPVLGSIDEVRSVIARSGAEVVIACAASLGAAQLRELSWALEGTGTDYMVAPNLVEVGSTRISLHPTSGSALLDVQVDSSLGGRIAKVALDRIAGAILLVVASVVLVPAAIAVKVTSPGPALFRQTRIGSDGHPFTMYKLRSMSSDADRRLAELADRSDGNGTLFKMRQDPRVTPVGQILRRYSIDELPQLINVVRGNMSLVGPRPPLPAETETYDATTFRRLKVKPGLTGLWQVSGRSDLSWEQSVRLDLRYVDNRSMPMDLRILGRTFGAVFGGRGAY